MNPTKPTLKTEIIPLLLIVFCFVASFYFYAHFPQRIATHWGFNGEPNGWSSALFAAFFFPFLNLGMYLLFLVIPFLDPKKDRYAEFTKAYHIFKGFIIGLLAIVYFMVGLNGIGYYVPVGSITPVMVGLLFIIIGNYLNKFKSNWMMGVRNPWTLSSETIWNKTHRLAGKIFILAGIAMTSEAWLPIWLQLPIFITIITAVAIIPNVYSYILYRAEQKEKNI
ncbi:MAG: SdpI family protein [Candidatus Magasanikbacteria bacterium]